MQARRRTLLFAAIAVLYLLSIPWYRTPGTMPVLWFGFPDWAVFALLCYAAIAVLNAVLWLTSEIPEAPRDTDAASVEAPAPTDARTAPADAPARTDAPAAPPDARAR